MQNRIAELRKENRLKQEAVANILHLSTQQYGRLERGEIDDTLIQHLLTLAQYYNVSLDYLMGLNEGPDIELNRVISSLSTEQKEWAIDVIKRAQEVFDKN